MSSVSSMVCECSVNSVCGLGKYERGRLVVLGYNESRCPNERASCKAGPRVYAGSGWASGVGCGALGRGLSGGLVAVVRRVCICTWGSRPTPLEFAFV